MGQQSQSSRIEKYLSFAEEMPAHFPPQETGGICRNSGDIRQVEKDVGERYRRLNLDPAWAEVGLHYEDPYCRVVRDAVRFPGGRDVVHHRVLWKSGPISGVVMLPRFEGRFVLIKHYRHPILRCSWECPRGGTTEGEPLEVTVQKELREEIGATVIGSQRLGHMLPINSFIDSGVDLFLVELGEIGQPETLEGVERILLLEAAEIKDIVGNGEITDASTICAVAQATFRGVFD